MAFALKNHLAVFELSDEIEIAALIVDPSLLPLIGAGIEDRDAGAAQMGCVSAPEKFSCTTQPSMMRLIAVGAVADFTGVLAGPREVPFANPEIKLLLLRGGAGISRGGAVGRKAWKRGRESSTRILVMRIHRNDQTRRARKC